MVESLDQKQSAETKIQALAKELNIHLLTDPELQKVTIELESGMNYGKYSDEEFPYK